MAKVPYILFPISLDSGMGNMSRISSSIFLSRFKATVTVLVRPVNAQAWQQGPIVQVCTKVAMC